MSIEPGYLTHGKVTRMATISRLIMISMVFCRLGLLLKGWIIVRYLKNKDYYFYNQLREYSSSSTYLFPPLGRGHVSDILKAWNAESEFLKMPYFMIYNIFIIYIQVMISYFLYEMLVDITTCLNSSSYQHKPSSLPKKTFSMFFICSWKKSIEKLQ